MFLRETEGGSPPNTGMEPTPQAAEDRGHFDSWKRLDSLPDLQGAAAQRQAVGRQLSMPNDY